jgi:hypothetical protein
MAPDKRRIKKETGATFERHLLERLIELFVTHLRFTAPNTAGKRHTRAQAADADSCCTQHPSRHESGYTLILIDSTE